MRLVSPTHIPRVVSGDPDDNHVIACGLAAGVDAIVSGDQHLLRLAKYEGMRILTPSEAMKIIGSP